jgi:long-chain acyl-CoA synthetase
VSPKVLEKGAELADDTDLLADLQRAVDASNQQVSRAEGIREFQILGDGFSVDSGELTPTMKVKRAAVIDREQSMIEDIHRDRR